MFRIFKINYRNFLTGSNRTVIIKRNILGLFAVKGLSVLISLFLVPYTLHLLDKEKYGIWLTIFSIVSWFSMMDMGIGNGFRNKFAEAIAVGKKEIAKEYVQTFYSYMALITITLLLINTAISPLLNWYKILNISSSFNENISLIVWSTFALFCIQLYLNTISTILLSLQRTTFSSSLLLIGNIGALIIIFILQKINMITLFSISLVFMTTSIIVFGIATIYCFNGSMKELKPKLLTLPKKKYLNDLIGLGLKFFFIQITMIVMFSSSNIIITQLYGPAEVTPYNITFRLYASALTIFTIIMYPFWTAFTEANALEDYSWIRKSIKKLTSIWLIFSVCIFILWIISPVLFRIWIGSDIEISYSLSFQFAIYTLLISWISLFVNYINGISKIKLQLYIAIFQCIFNIPLAVILAKYAGLNTTGVILATNINLLISAILLPIQYNKLINKSAHGIWSK